MDEFYNMERNSTMRKWGKQELIGRLLWALVSPLFKYSPRLFWGWRRFLLRIFGARVGKSVCVHPSAKIFIPWNLEIGDWSAVGFDALLYNLGPMNIGERVTISQRAHLCGGSHDFRDSTMPLLKLPLVVKDDAWVCSDAFIGPNITIGCRAVVGACAVVTKDVFEDQVVAGNPARVIGDRNLV